MNPVPPRGAGVDRALSHQSTSTVEPAPFLSFDVEIRKVICSANAIESVNSRIRKAARARGHFPNEAATDNPSALHCPEP